MKEFFLDLLNNLDKLAGLRQLENIYKQHTDPIQAKAEVNNLLNLLVSICLQFPYIPDEDKKRIIQQYVVSDPDFNSLNARIVYKWLSLQKDKYYKQMSHIGTEQPEDWKPVPKDSPEYQNYLNQWLAALEPMQERINSTATRKEIAILGIEREGKTNYQPMTDDEVLKRDKHLQYIRANYNPITRGKLDGWLPEDQWNEINK